MSKFLSQNGLTVMWAKIKAYVIVVVDAAMASIGDYTVNGKKISTNPILGKEDIGLSNVTNDAQVMRSEMGKAGGVATLGTDGKLTDSQLPALKTVNGSSIIGSGDIKIDLSLFKVVESLPTTDIDVNKIYLVLSSKSGTENTYTEYGYVNNKWEKFGEYTATVDLSPYVKFTDLASAIEAGVMSKEDYVLLHDTATSLATLAAKVNELVTAGGEPNVIESVNVNGTALPITNKTVNIPAASTDEDGVMSKTDKAKLDGIVELTEEEINAICV